MSTEPRVPRRILVPLDGTPDAESILPFVETLARPLDLEVLLLRVVPSIPSQVVGETADHMARLREESDRYLKGVADRLAVARLRAVTAVRVGDVPTQIAEAALEHEADLIAMASHARTALGRLFFGSVAQEVVRRSDVPVLLARVPETLAARRAA